MRDAVMLFDDAAQPDIAGGLKVGAADTFSNQVLRIFDARVDIDESKTVAKPPVQKNRNSSDRHVVLARHEVRTDVKFTDVVFQISRHAPVTLSRSVGGQDDELEPVSLDGSLLEGTDNFIIAARNGQSQLG